MRRYIALFIIIVLICYGIYLGCSNGGKNTGFVGKIKSTLDQTPDLTASEIERRKRAEKREQRKARRGERYAKVAEGEPQQTSHFAGVFENQMKYFEGNDD